MNEHTHTRKVREGGGEERERRGGGSQALFLCREGGEREKVGGGEYLWNGYTAVVTGMECELTAWGDERSYTARAHAKRERESRRESMCICVCSPGRCLI